MSGVNARESLEQQVREWLDGLLAAGRMSADNVAACHEELLDEPESNLRAFLRDVQQVVVGEDGEP